MDTEQRLFDLTHAVYDQTIALARIGDLLEFNTLRSMEANMTSGFMPGSARDNRERELRNHLWPEPKS